MASPHWRVPTGPIRRPVAASPAQPRYQGSGAGALTPQDLVRKLRFIFTDSDLLYAPWCLQAADLIEEMLVKKTLQTEMLQALTDLVTLANLAEHSGEEVHFSPYSPLMMHIRTLVDVVREEEQAEPVAWMYVGIKHDGTTHGPHLVWKPEHMDAMSAEKGVVASPLYTAPPRREWRGLTEEEIIEAVREADLDWHRGWTLEDGESNRYTKLACILDGVLKEKNHE